MEKQIRSEYEIVWSMFIEYFRFVSLCLWIENWEFWQLSLQSHWHDGERTKSLSCEWFQSFSEIHWALYAMFHCLKWLSCNQIGWKLSSTQNLDSGRRWKVSKDLSQLFDFSYLIFWMNDNEKIPNGWRNLFQPNGINCLKSWFSWRYPTIQKPLDWQMDLRKGINSDLSIDDGMLIQFNQIIDIDEKMWLNQNLIFAHERSWRLPMKALQMSKSFVPMKNDSHW
jgi:hypothetical protein